MCSHLILCNMQSIEMGASALLLDEDTCATNFMIRDSKMTQLVAADKEPITPFVSIVRSLYNERQVSTILVVGGSGDFFDVADLVLMMDCYSCVDATERAKAIVSQFAQTNLEVPRSVPFGSTQTRQLVSSQLNPNGKVKVMSRCTVYYGDVELDLSGLEQIVSTSQTHAIIAALQKLAFPRQEAGGTALRDLLQELDQSMEENGIGCLVQGQLQGQLMRPRLIEISGAINRLRRACICQQN